MAVDLLIRGVQVVDGTGSPWFYGDVAIEKGRTNIPSDVYRVR